MPSLFDRLKNIFRTPTEEDLLRFPEKLLSDIKGILDEDESLVFSIKALSAKYKAPRLLDSNTFFNPFFILTTRRVIIARNSSRLNIFREIELRNILDHKIESSGNSPGLTLKHYNASDIITFHPSSPEQSEQLDGFLSELLEKRHSAAGKTIFCRYCGEKIPADSNFCPECGSRQ